jgi:hypothetical protein
MIKHLARSLALAKHALSLRPIEPREKVTAISDPYRQQRRSSRRSRVGNPIKCKNKHGEMPM